MKVSLNWLKQYIDIQESPEKVAELLTDSGLEVEGLTELEAIPGGLDGVVVGNVLKCEQHPNADRLKVTTVDVGQEQPLQIVCGAPNVATGQKVAVATVGTVLQIGDKPLKIKKGKLRGEVSEGMICAEDELGLGDSHDGIMILDDATQIGTPLSDALNLQSDHTIEIGLTPNRVDGASHIGVARDIKALSSFHNNFKLGKEIHWPAVDGFSVSSNDLDIDVEIENTEACPRYSATTIKGVTVTPSPDWLQQRLRSIGLSPINNVVDVTNFVLHELGQPLHAFDAGKIKGNKVVVKTLQDSTKFTTLDEAERELSQDDLMICNSEEGMCIAGVFGGLTSGVTESTTDVFLESAYFNPVWIRKTAKRHGLNTDASFRYERGTDPEITIYALKRAALLIQEVAGGEVAMEIKDVYPTPIEPFKVSFSVERCNKLIGAQLQKSDMELILESLDFDILDSGDDVLELSIPTYRVDVQREADVVEEVLRIYGYNQVPVPTKLHSSLSFVNPEDRTESRKRLSNWFAANGFHEVMNNSLSSQARINERYKENAVQPVKLSNPLSQELDVMRPDLIAGILEVIQYNFNRKQRDLKLFEFGSVYNWNKSKASETEHLLIAITGAGQPDNWAMQSKESDFFYLKGCVEQLIAFAGFDRFRIDYSESNHPLLEYGLSVSINKQRVIDLGAVSVDLAANYEIDQDVIVAQIDFEVWHKWESKAHVRFQPIPKFPSVSRDLALLLNEEVQFEELKKQALKADKRIEQVDLFDVYKGEHIEAGKKSYAIRFTIQDTQNTLTDDQIDQVMNKVLKNARKALGAELR